MAVASVPKKITAAFIFAMVAEDGFAELKCSLNTEEFVQASVYLGYVFICIHMLNSIMFVPNPCLTALKS